ncbi:hypothetical protein GCM10025875_30660 [Litorihabitans aurantiacus]|uniref:Uncharacterized protein n=1 Tax=Litorihabitans aurantiacus TaxID=1930061 RepID=A0AA37XHB4_9MICO|nr:hypothetical protein GCM10025875_30660 [Litorihabitans aurantiacus]
MPVPMVAVANGRTRVDVSVTSPDGVVIGVGETFDLRVRAEWETVGTGIVAAALGLLLVVGLVRTVRRGRRDAGGHVPGTHEGGEDDGDGGSDAASEPDDTGEPATPGTGSPAAPPATRAST